MAASLPRRTPRPARAPGKPVGDHPLVSLNIAAGLEPHTNPLSPEEAAHLLRRTGFGVEATKVSALVGQTAAQAVQSIMSAAQSAAPLPTPSWLGTLPPPESAPDSAFEAFFDANEGWVTALMYDLIGGMRRGGLADRMTVFWLNHFVTGFESYEVAEFAFRYFNLLRNESLGNFEALTRTIGKQPAMLFYLDGFLNEKDAPNENYARELMELFTCGLLDPAGQANYTEKDISEIARALTGWTVSEDNFEVIFEAEVHDFGTKSFLGRTGSFGYDDVVDILFAQRANSIAHHLARKLYREFVYAVPDDAIVQGLASELLRNQFEVTPVLATLFGSAHFFDPLLRGARLKSPLEYVVGLAKALGLPDSDGVSEELYYTAQDLGQSMLEPPNVAGWPGHRNWLDTTSLPMRWSIGEFLLWDWSSDEGLRATAEALHDPFSSDAPFRLAVALAEHLLPVPIAELDLPPSGLSLGGDLATNPVPAAVASQTGHERELVLRFLNGQPWYEWSLLRQDAPERLREFIDYLIRLPEFQLT